jgi:4-hydroxybenzoate polyprenyltransferase
MTAIDARTAADSGTGRASERRTSPASTWRSFAVFAGDIKLAHSVFALPFAASAFVLGGLPLPSARAVVLALVCMVTARSFAMGMNRVLDRMFDVANPRTRGRAIPSGAMTARQGLRWSLLAAAIFVGAAAALSPLAGWLAVPLLLVLLAYSYMKRLTWLTHWYLGLCLGLAPVAVQVALTGTVTLPVLLLGGAVAAWTGGFDVLYALADWEFDRNVGLSSFPGRFGPGTALWASRLSFAAMIGALMAAGWLGGRGAVYFVGVALIGGVLAWEHVLVRDAKADGKSANLNRAFFDANAFVSVGFFAVTALDALVVGYHGS